MSAEAIVGICVGAAALFTFIGHMIRIGYRLARTAEKVLERVDALEAILNNGIRAEITQARRLASDAARAAAVADQTSREGQAQLQRAINALRAEVDIYTNVVIEDRHRIRRSLVEAGLDLRDDDEE